MSANTLRIRSTPPVLISAICVATSGMARMTRCLNAGLPRQWPSKASRRMYWSRFHSTNFHGPVPTAAVVPNASSPTFSMCFLGTMGKNTSRSSRSGNGLSVTICTVSASTMRTSLIARMLPYWGDFFFSLPGSSTRSKENFTSSAVSGSPLWNFTPLRSLNSHCVSLRGFQEVASDGSYSSLVFRCSSESNMLMLTRMPTRSKCMWGSRVGACETSATVRVSLAWAKAGAGPTSARSASATAGTMDRFMSVSSSVHRDRAPGSRCKKRAAATYRVAEVYHGWAALDNAPAGWDPRARRRAPIRSGSGEGAVEGLGEVRDQVVGVLDADREADQVVLDADLEALLAGELVEAHDRGLLDQALHPAQRGRDERDRARVHHPGRRVEIARDLEGDHPAEAAHL